MSVEGTAKERDVLKGKVVSIPQIDDTLTKAGYGADSKVVGDKLKEIDNKASATPKASGVTYSNTTSELSAKDVQSAIDEIVAKAKKDIEDLATKYLGLNGGTLKGQLAIQHCDNGHTLLNKNHSESADYGTYIADVSKDGRSAKVSVCAALNMYTFTDVDNNVLDIHHEGTKPFSEYTGNGSETERVIDTKGIGRMLMIYHGEHILLVTPKGALKVVLTDGTMAWVSSSNIYFVDGKLTIASDNEAFNKANETYYYQVI